MSDDKKTFYGVPLDEPVLALATLDFVCWICQKKVGALVMPTDVKRAQYALEPLRRLLEKNGVKGSCQECRDKYNLKTDMSDLK